MTYPETHIRNAKIESTFLGVEDHGIMTFGLDLNYGVTRQGFGYYSLDSYDQNSKSRVGHPDSIILIRKILEIVGVTKWEDLKGKYIRVVSDSDGFGSNILGIGNIVEDKWLYVKDYFKIKGN